MSDWRKLIIWMRGAFEAKEVGASARKWSAFIVMFLVVWIEASWVRYSFQKDNFSLLPEILIINFSFVTSMFGLATWRDYLQSKNKQAPDGTTEKSA